MNKVLIDFPEKYQQNAFTLWMQQTGFELFQAYYAKEMPEERQPSSMEIEHDVDLNKHLITIE